MIKKVESSLLVGAESSAVERSESDRRLEEIGVPGEVIVNAILEAVRSAQELPPAAATGAQGQVFYHTFVAHVRMELTERGLWESMDRNNVPTCRHRKHPSRELFFSSGNDGVGIEGRIPNFKYEKGPASRGQLALDLEIPTLPKGDDREIWVVLYTRTDDAVRVEVSRLLACSGGFAEEWDERIILDPVQSGTPTDLVSSFEGQEVQFDVTEQYE